MREKWVQQCFKQNPTQRQVLRKRDHLSEKKKEKRLVYLSVTATNAMGICLTNPIPLSSSSLSRHITACGGNPDLRFQLLQSSQCSRSVGGSLLMSSRLCGRVLRAVRPGIHQRRPRQRAFLDMCVVQLPPAWNMSSRNRWKVDFLFRIITEPL